jgi:hypothetical protein
MQIHLNSADLKTLVKMRIMRERRQRERARWVGAKAEERAEVRKSDGSNGRRRFLTEVHGHAGLAEERGG